MIVKVEIPGLTVYPDGFPRYWLNITFLGNSPDEYKVHAIVTTYVWAGRRFLCLLQSGSRIIKRVWNNHSKKSEWVPTISRLHILSTV